MRNKYVVVTWSEPEEGAAIFGPYGELGACILADEIENANERVDRLDIVEVMEAQPIIDIPTVLESLGLTRR